MWPAIIGGALSLGGGIAGSLMGGDDEPDTTMVSGLLPKQLSLLKDVIREARRGLRGRGQTYKGRVVPGATDLQKQLFELVGEYGAGRAPYQEGIRSFLEKSMEEFDPTATREWYEEAVKDPAWREWREEIAPEVTERFISRGAGVSGAANRAISKSAADLQADLGSVLANVLFQERGRHKEGQFRATDTARSQLESIISALSGAGGIKRQIAAEKGGEKVAKWQLRHPYAGTSLLQYALNPASEPLTGIPGQQGPGLLSTILTGLGGMPWGEIF